MTPYSSPLLAGNQQLQKEGARRIAAGKVGCIIAAGGLGSRLGFSGPKGCYPLKEGITLFTLLCRRAKGPLAIMTSPSNHEATLRYFAEEGLQAEFFCQEELPLLDDEGNVRGKGPNGNGRALALFAESPLLTQWKDRGVEEICFICVDNALADPFDPELIGLHHTEENEVTIKAAERRDPHSLWGLVVQTEEGIRIVEYCDMPEEERARVEEDGLPTYRVGNISNFCFSMQFVERSKTFDYPLHRVYKKGLWKRETFIFDTLQYAKKIGLLCYPEELCYAALKNAEGKDSPETVLARL